MAVPGGVPAHQHPAQVRDRDQGISDRQPPPVFWDQQTALEAAAVWGALCNECHGGRRKVEDAIKMPPPPAGWGRGEGLFFGVRRPYEALFNIVWNGGPDRNGKKSEMPAWRNRLAREQIWAILYFLEYQSGRHRGPLPAQPVPAHERSRPVVREPTDPTNQSRGGPFPSWGLPRLALFSGWRFQLRRRHERQVVGDQEAVHLQAVLPVGHLQRVGAGATGCG